VKAVCRRVWPDCVVSGVEVASGVANQPMSSLETKLGASNRAKAALAYGDMGVGIEGGVEEIDGKLYVCSWAAIKDHGNEGCGGGIFVELPERVRREIILGRELGEVMAELFNHDVGHNEGTVGVFTKGMVTRQGAFEQLVKISLVRWISKEWF